MASYTVSKRAGFDLDEIVEFTVKKWSVRQAARYLKDLHATFTFIAAQPAIGRPVERRPGLRRWEHMSHVVFYRPKGTGVTITRVLHEGMLPKLHWI